MKQYSHDYTLPSKADSLLYSATCLMANDCHDAALERINEARQLLQQYLSQDNMVEDDDVADGYVRYQEAAAEIEKLRRTLDDNQETQHTQNLLYFEIVRRSEEMIRKRDRMKEENDSLRDRINQLEQKLPKL